jgi:isoquinoline 1-oxidoreductase beta subunit
MSAERETIIPPATPADEHEQATPEAPESASAGEPTRRRWRLTRRGFLIGLGVVGAGLALGIGAGATVGLPFLRLQLAGQLEGSEGMPGNYPEDPWAWFEVLPDSRIRLYLMKVEMGQGIHTALAQVAAEELEIAWDDLEVAQATTNRNMGSSLITSGSSSVSTVFAPLLQAAATFRTMLQAQAARLLQVAPDQLVVQERGFQVAGDPTRRVDLAAVAASTTEWEAPATAVPLKSPAEYKTIGRPLPRGDIPGKVTGATVFAMDARAAGMKYGAVVRKPTIAATLKSLAAGTAGETPGVVNVVVLNDQNGGPNGGPFGGVVADSRLAAEAAVGKMAAEWDPGYPWQQDEIMALVSVGNGGGITVQDVGYADRLLREETTLMSEYRTPFAIHTPLEAQAALAEVRDEGVRIWTSTQAQGLVRTEVAKALKLKEEQVEIIPTFVGGGYGRKTGYEAAVEAALLARASGVPVHVGWTRADEMRQGYFRSPTHHVLHGRLDAAGNLLAIEHRQASGKVAFDFLPGFVAAVMGADFGAYRGATIRYEVPNKRTVAWLNELPVRTGWWRGLGLLPNTFAVESFVDELAHAAKADPLEFRLRHLGTDGSQGRLRKVFAAAAEAAGWGTPLPEGRARGIAGTLDVDTAVAQVAEVSRDRTTGKIRVHKVTAAMDCGLTVNPDGAKAQVEGNVMWGTGSALIEEMTVKDGVIEPANFDRYPLLTMKEAPQVEVILLEAGDGRPRGVGEPSIGPTAPAIANAFFALTGVRLRQLPLKPETIKN